MSCRSVVLTSLSAGLVLISTAMAYSDVKALVGRWEGEIRFANRGTPNQGRVLAITSLTQAGGKYTASAEYGIVGRPLRPVSLEIYFDATGISISFVTGANNPVELHLISESVLSGKIRFSPSASTDMRLEKVVRLWLGESGEMRTTENRFCSSFAPLPAFNVLGVARHPVPGSFRGDSPP